MGSNDRNGPWQALREKVDFLSQSSSYLEECSHIETIETHMSWIFLTDQYAYKLKKPTLLSYLDMSKLKQRHIHCLQELKLNCILAPDIYLAVIPLIKEKNHQFYPVGVNKKGNIVEWLIKMQRFPREKTLDQLIMKNKIDKKLLADAAMKLNNFYLQSPPLTVHPKQFLMYLNSLIKQNRNELTRAKYGLNSWVVNEISEAQFHAISQLSSSISQRVGEGKISECHGDLRPEHICLTSPPIIIDRLEFNKELRILDPVDELAYLSVECEVLGRPDVGAFFCTSYEKRLEDHILPQLLTFYKSYRACLRARISIWHLDDPRVLDLDKWYRKACAYLEHATIICN